MATELGEQYSVDRCLIDADVAGDPIARTRPALPIRANIRVRYAQPLEDFLRWCARTQSMTFHDFWCFGEAHDHAEMQRWANQRVHLVGYNTCEELLHPWQKGFKEGYEQRIGSTIETGWASAEDIFSYDLDHNPSKRPRMSRIPNRGKSNKHTKFQTVCSHGAARWNHLQKPLLFLEWPLFQGIPFTF